MSAAEPYVIGIDLGGTNVRAASISPAGQVFHYDDRLIEAARGPQAGLERIGQLIAAVQAATLGSLAGIGIGSTGPIDREKGAIQNPYTLPTWEDVDIVRPLSQRFGVPVALENDADAAALGEHWLGAGRGEDRMAAVTVGTGIGTAFILNGQIYRGMGGVHGEAGHQVLDPSGPPCYCGARGCWEQLAAGPGIANAARALLGRLPTRLLEMVQNQPERIEASLVAAAAREGDPLARRVMADTARWLGLGLVNLILFWVPDGVVLSGGVMRSFDLLEPGIREVIAQHDKMVPAREVRIHLSNLGRQAGVTGAARAILNDLNLGETR